MRVDPKWVGGGILAALAGVAGAFYLNEKLAEKPAYRPLLTDGDIQLRVYPRLIVASTTKPGARKAALDAGFRTLAGYIFARGREGPRIKMTAPVLSDRSGDGWRTRFVMPSAHRLDTLPEPATDEVTIEPQPSRRMVSIRFSGRADDATLAAKEASLRAWIEKKGLRIDGDPLHAFYDSPYIPPALRRSEVMIPVG